jgi:hypothetical protein
MGMRFDMSKFIEALSTISGALPHLMIHWLVLSLFILGVSKFFQSKKQLQSIGNFFRVIFFISAISAVCTFIFVSIVYILLSFNYLHVRDTESSLISFLSIKTKAEIRMAEYKKDLCDKYIEKSNKRNCFHFTILEKYENEIGSREEKIKELISEFCEKNKSCGLKKSGAIIFRYVSDADFLNEPKYYNSLKYCVLTFGDGKWKCLLE